MYCPFCGTDNATDQKYCRNCGASLPTTTANKPPTKTHSSVPSSSNPRPSGPFVPPAPPSLPKRGKPLEPTNKPSLEEAEDPGATNLSYKLPGFEPKPSTQTQSSNDIVENFYETQAMANILMLSNASKATKPAPNTDLRTVEMGSLSNPSDEDLKSTNVGMPVATFTSESAGRANTTSKSEEYFPTVLTQPKPPESPEEQLQLLKELMEAGEESWKVPPPAPPPPVSISSDQTLTMAAVSKPSEANSNSDKSPVVSESSNKAFDQTLNSIPAFSLQKSDQPPLSPPKAEDIPFDPIPQTLTMKAVPKNNKAKGEDFSYPNLEGPITSEEIMPETVQMQRPAFESDDIASALNTWSSDVTNPWGTPTPSLSTPQTLDAKTDTLTNKAFSAPQQEKGKSKKDAFKTISVGPRSQKPGQAQKDLPTNPLSSVSSSFLDDMDPNKTAISTAYVDFAQEKSLPNTAPIAISNNPSVELSTPTIFNAPTEHQMIAPSIPTLIDSTPTQIETSRETSRETLKINNRPSLKVPFLISIIVILIASIIFIAWKLVENISTVPQTSNVTPQIEPSPIATSETATTPEPIAVSAPENMVLIPGGEYNIGSNELGPKEDTFSSPQHLVTVAAFYMDIYEVTNKEYSDFAQATGHIPPKEWQNGQYSGKPQEPVTDVSWEDAQAYAKWANKRLPTEEEWEIAASGPEHFLYPWGNAPDTTHANSKEFKAKSVRTVVGSIKTSKSPFGLYDMSGNVWEWTSSPAKSYPNSTDPKITDPKHQRVFRGGSFQDTIEYCVTTFRGYDSIKRTSPILGFRCAKDAPQN